jgi:hypothetical protein
LQARNAIACFGVGGAIEANSTMHRANGFKISEDSKSIITLTALRTRPATSIE